jgi:uncharacterized membrane protein
MNFYNKIMLYFWFAMFLVTTLTVTYRGFMGGFDRWYFYYIFGILALLMFLVRRWMLKRMKKHLEFLEEQKNKQTK